MTMMGSRSKGTHTPNANANRLTNEETTAFAELFESLDSSGKGFLRRREIREGLALLGQHIPKSEIEMLVGDRKGLSEVEFRNLLANRYFLHNTDRDSYLQCFREVDINSDGTISVNELNRLFTAMGQSMPKEDLQYIFNVIGAESIENERFVDYLLEVCSSTTHEEDNRTIHAMDE